ncbi:MAG: ferrous iron transport protein B [Actinomycetota bacterium]
MSAFRIDYGSEIEAAVEQLVERIDQLPDVSSRYPTRWLAVALLDRDPGIDEQLQDLSTGSDVLGLRDQLVAELRETLGEAVDTAIAGRRFDVVHDIASSAAEGLSESALTRTDRIDAVVTNRFLGIPIFLAAMWIVFKVTTDVAGAFLDWVDGAVSGPISSLVASFIDLIGLEGTWVESLLIDGAVAGVGAILVFVPVLISLYLALAFLEDTGYMARAAFVMDRLMRGVGLQGKSFLPMLVGFGCTVPAVYATRTLDNERDRILTSLLVPFMSCGARLPVYVLMSAVFFPDNAGLIVFSMYLLGIAVALVLGLILRKTALPVTGYAPTIMEMPPYRMPTVRTIWFHTWVRTKSFLEEAGTIIFVTMLVVWLLMAIPASSGGTFADTDVDDSAFATVAGVVAPVFEPAGFGSWEASGALMSGFVAKEVVIGTMAQVYGVEGIETVGDDPSVIDSIKELVVGFGEATLEAIKAIPGIIGIDLGSDDEAGESSALMSSIRAGFEESSGGHGRLAALAFMVFVLLYTPCMAAVGAIRHEVGTRWMWFSVIGQSAIAWVFAVAVFQGGQLLGLG